MKSNKIIPSVLTAVAIVSPLSGQAGELGYREARNQLEETLQECRESENISVNTREHFLGELQSYIDNEVSLFSVAPEWKEEIISQYGVNSCPARLARTLDRYNIEYSLKYD